MRGIDAGTVPRFKLPTGDELEQMFHEPTPGECYERCIHREVCTMWNHLDGTTVDEAADYLTCIDCPHWTE